MTQTGISSLDHAPQVVAEWLNELCEELGWSETGRAYLLLRTVLHATRDFLSPNEASDLAAQMPLLIKGVFYDGWNPAHTPAEHRSREDFVGRVTDVFSKEPLDDAEEAVRAVLRVLARHVSEGEVSQVAGSMKKPLRDLWPAGAS